MNNSHALIKINNVLSEADIFISPERLRILADEYSQLTGETYQQQVIQPAEQSERLSVIKLVSHLAEKIIHQEEDGALYVAEIELLNGDTPYRMGIVAQNRRVNNGAWSPSQHRQAVQWVRLMEQRHLPIVCFIDTPGAEAGAKANEQNQAHRISELIATMADVKVPTIGLIWGFGYSGGAIPLATTNLLYSVKDGLFSTIQPKGLASIARKQKLDWQTCARLVGVSAPELYQEGVIDGVIDYSPLNAEDQVLPIHQAIIFGINHIENQSRNYVHDHTETQSYVDETLQRFINSELDQHRQLSPMTVSGFPSVFGFAHSLQRSETLHSRLKTQSVKWQARNEIQTATPISPEAQQLLLSKKRFDEWLQRDDKLIYEEDIHKSWEKFRDSEAHIEDDRGYIVSLFLGDPKENRDKAYNELTANIAFYLYNRWQQEAPHHLSALIDSLNNLEEDTTCNRIPDEHLHIINLIQDSRFKEKIIEHCQQLTQFDRLYETLLSRLTNIVSELSESKKVSGTLLDSLLDSANTDSAGFSAWLLEVQQTPLFGDFLRTAEHWKKVQHPRQSDVVFVVVSYFFEKLYPELFESKKPLDQFSETFNPVSIGRRKNFWHRLSQAIQDLRIQAILNQVKPSSQFSPHDLINTLFSQFLELDTSLTSTNPRQFPGFGDALLRQQKKKASTSGLITGIANFILDGKPETLGLFVSNHSFQAGAFDMSASERLCRLLDYCSEHNLPAIGFISSGGMQTKEGASALFSMAVVNDRINHFVSDNGLPLMIFGYGDCTGGAQASLVTHPLVDTYYFSGTNMPFAGRIVVPEYLPVTATLSNYLLTIQHSMQGLVAHPMLEDLDNQLQTIDPLIPIAKSTVTECIQEWLTNAERTIQVTNTVNRPAELIPDNPRQFAPFKKVLVHARGCTAVKLIREAHALSLNVVLVQSDPDMTSVAADMLIDDDSLVCLGGYTSDESYLNADSVLQIADMNSVEALHPGIGFLSENSQFAQQCLDHGLQFIGPSPASMNAMGDKSQAINTALSLDVPVVPGSHGLLKNYPHALELSQKTGFPIILKAAHGGGGKGIAVVETADKLEETFHRIKTEALSSFGSDAVYLERLVTRFRHIEVQLLRDSLGNTRILGLRDCSIQRNKQKIIEESLSTMLSAELQEEAEQATIKLADACHYQGAGTVEFIFDLDRQALYFMEMNARLQVEHPVTEAVTGINIVQAQYKIAMGESIADMQPRQQGYAIEVRINAEQVSLDQGELCVTPSPGTLTQCDFPDEEGIQQIVAVAKDKTITPFYDNLIAQIIVHDKSREAAVQKMRNYLSRITIKGIDTNIPLLQVILNDKVFLSGEYSTNYLPELFASDSPAIFVLKKAENDPAAQTGESKTIESNRIQAIQIQGSNELKVLAPSTGILYSAPSPDQPEYLNEGDSVSVDQTLCLLEAMKMFQPLTLSSFNQANKETYPANQEYRISHIKGIDGQQVNKGDLLFVIQPIEDQRIQKQAIE